MLHWARFETQTAWCLKIGFSFPLADDVISLSNKSFNSKSICELKSHSLYLLKACFSRRGCWCARELNQKFPFDISFDLHPFHLIYVPFFLAQFLNNFFVIIKEQKAIKSCTRKRKKIFSFEMTLDKLFPIEFHMRIWQRKNFISAPIFTRRLRRWKWIKSFYWSEAYLQLSLCTPLTQQQNEKRNEKLFL